MKKFGATTVHVLCCVFFFVCGGAGLLKTMSLAIFFLGDYEI